MYYEEKFENGVWYSRSTPDGAWSKKMRQMSKEDEPKWSEPVDSNPDNVGGDVQKALDIADARLEDVKDIDFGEVFWACGILASQLRSLTQLTKPPENVTCGDVSNVGEALDVSAIQTIIDQYFEEVLKNKSFQGRTTRGATWVKANDQLNNVRAALQTPASDTPPQSPNRAVLDALDYVTAALKFGVNVPEENMGNVASAIDMAEKALAAAENTQGDNMKVIDALKAVKSQAELLYGDDAKFNLFYIYAEMGLAAAEQADVVIIDGLEDALSEYKKDGWNIHDETLATLAIGAEAHLKLQKGR